MLTGSGRLRVQFLTLYPDVAASPRYRVHQFLPYLRERGFECSVEAPLTAEEYVHLTAHPCPRRYHFIETRRRLAQLLSAGRHDIVFVQKAITSAYLRGMDALLRRRARRIVYDIDDAVHLRPPHPLRGVARAVENRAQIQAVMRSSNLVLAGNAWLADEARAHANRVELFHTVVDTDRFVPARVPPRAFTVGWIGGPSTTPHLETLVHCAELHKAELLLVGADAARIPWPHARVVPWSLNTEVEHLHGMSVGIMPLPKDDWSRGKCALKALLYMSCGIPCVATPFGAVLDIIEHGITGFFADTSAEWDAAILQLQDAGERERVGAAARDAVVTRFSLKTAAPRMAELLESLG